MPLRILARPSRSLRLRTILGSALAVAASPVHATEVEFAGFYRARMHVFETLSLDRDLSVSEGLAWYAQHRLWLRPRFVVSDAVTVTADFRGLDGVVWGHRPVGTDNPLPGAAPVFEHDLTAPVSLVDAEAPLLDFTLWRAWGEVHTKFGKFAIGRMPLHWGSGIWLNDGVSVRVDQADHGDTADRVAWEYLIQNQVFLMAAFDINDEDVLNAEDDTTSYNLGAAYRTEMVTTGLTGQLLRAPVRSFNLVTIDAALDAELGKLRLAAEATGQFGAGDIDEQLNDVSITAVGSMLSLGLDLTPWRATVEAGLATGDGDPNDQRIKTFTFDRDYSVGLMLFEQPMPTLVNTLPGVEDLSGRSTADAVTGTALSNALYLRPSLERQILEGWWVEARWLGARVAKVPESDSRGRSYGMEFGLGTSYEAIPHVDVGLDLGLFLPGATFSDHVPTDFPQAQFGDPVFGSQLSTRFHF